jgi:1-acyl-sn-glycerol-3-phosphate acyltransferase
VFESCVSSVVSGGTKLLTGAHARWSEGQPGDRPRVYFANHTSHADFVLLWSALPPSARSRTHPVAASDYWSASRFRHFLAHGVFRSVLVERACACKSDDTLGEMIAVLDRGGSLILFPEGTRGTGDDLLPFRSGIFHIARRRPHVELVPAWIENANRMMPKGSFLPLPVLCRVTFGASLKIESGEEKAAFLHRLQETLRSLKTYECAG